MARVPYEPYPTERPTEGTGARSISVSTPNIGADAFGAQVGQALGHLGQVSGEAGNEMFQRAIAIQQLNNESEAKEADAKYMMKVGELHANFSNLEGKDAVNAFPGYMKSLNDLRIATRDSLSNDMARRMFDSSALSTMGRTIFNGAGHAATQQKQWFQGANQAQFQLDSQTIQENPFDSQLFEEKKARALDSARAVGHSKGWGDNDPQMLEHLKTAESALWADRIKGVNFTNPQAAEKMIEENSGKLIDKDMLQLETTVRNQGRAISSANIARSVYAENPDASIGEMENKIEDLTKTSKDPLLYQHAISTLHGLYNQRKYADKQFLIENNQTIDDAIIKSGAKTEQELRLNPTIAKAIDALPASEQLKIPARINGYQAARDKEGKDKTFKEILGQSTNDVEGFLNRDILSEDLSQGNMKYFMNLQKQLKKDPNQDPRVGRWMGVMRTLYPSQLEAMGVYHRNNKNPADYDHYTGAVQSSLDVWQDAHKRAPTYKEFQDQIAPELVKTVTEPYIQLPFLGKTGRIGTTQTPRFNQEVPEEWSNKVKADLQKRATDAGTPYTEPSEDELRAAYTRMQFIELYGQPGSKKDKSSGRK